MFKFGCPYQPNTWERKKQKVCVRKDTLSQISAIADVFSTGWKPNDGLLMQWSIEPGGVIEKLIPSG